VLSATTSAPARCPASHTVRRFVIRSNGLLGADLVVHSTTKYLNGHSDVVGGAVIARDSAHVEQLTWWANCLGLTGAPFDSYLTLRGVRTLHARMQIHETNAHAIASALDGHSAVLAVHYPGLSSHPGHAIAAGQQDGFGGMVSFTLAGGREAAQTVAEALEYFTLAESLGGVESLVAHPATMTHASMDAAARAAAGIGEGMLRLSVGIEDSRDLVEDLLRALDLCCVDQESDESLPYALESDAPLG
jgi:cystathionine gamma-synthase